MNPPLEWEENTETLSGSCLSTVCDSWFLEKLQSGSRVDKSESLIPGLEPLENFNRPITNPVTFRGSAKNTICNKNNKVRKNIGWDEANIMGRSFKMTLWLFRVDCLHRIEGKRTRIKWVGMVEELKRVSPWKILCGYSINWDQPKPLKPSSVDANHQYHFPWSTTLGGWSKHQIVEFKIPKSRYCQIRSSYFHHIITSKPSQNHKLGE